jgi:hypothetical protein
LELLGSFFFTGLRFHSVCFFFSFCMHGCTIAPSQLNVSACTQFRL